MRSLLKTKIRKIPTISLSIPIQQERGQANFSEISHSLSHNFDEGMIRQKMSIQRASIANMLVPKTSQTSNSGNE